MYKLGIFELPDPTDPRWEADKLLPAPDPIFSCGPISVSKEEGVFCVKVGGADLVDCDPLIRIVNYNEYANQVINYVTERERERRVEQVTNLLTEFNQRVKQ